MALSIRRLTQEDDVSFFDCGSAQLSTWLQKSALDAASQGTRTYLAFDERHQLIGYFAIAPHLLERGVVPKNIGRGGPRQIPTILLAKFAVSVDSHGTGFGTALLIEALALIVEAARASGGKLVVVDAIDESARTFYLHHNFISVPERDDRLLIKISTHAKALGLDWP